jgi:hypothetical protein
MACSQQLGFLGANRRRKENATGSNSQIGLVGLGAFDESVIEALPMEKQLDIYSGKFMRRISA